MQQCGKYDESVNTVTNRPSSWFFRNLSMELLYIFTPSKPKCKLPRTLSWMCMIKDELSVL